MRVVPLRLTRRLRASKATAWLVPGQSPAEWLDEVAQWPVNQTALRFLPLPQEVGQKPDAVFVLTDELLPESFRPPRAQVYRQIATNLYVPAEAVLEPDVIATEWRALFPGQDTIYVWRARGDLVGFEPDDVRSIVDLLTAPVKSSSDWTEAREAPAFVSRLRSIASLMSIPSLDDITMNWQNDVGSATSPDQLPPLPGEPPLHWTERLANATAGIRGLARRFANQFTALYHRFPFISRALGLVLMALLLVLLLRNLSIGTFGSWTEFLVLLLLSLLSVALIRWALSFDMAPENATRPQPRTATGSQIRKTSHGFWAWLTNRLTAAMPKTARFAPFAEANRRQREREIQRLMRMLEQNPEEGLKYAIPFGGDAGRGVATPGNQLVAHHLNFSFGFGGGVADLWQISVEQQLLLTASYRSLAEREQRAGRHRRAAYIYSRLLNDWRSAATVLVAGHHYADAAVIYEKRLQNIVEASKCFELAGQYDKALQLYVDSSNWIAAGDLCTRVERTEEAREHYRAAVTAAVSTGNKPYAAELLEQKLHEVDEALNLLFDAWPADTRSDVCLDAWFDLTARHHRTETALERVTMLSQETTQLEAMRVLPRLRRVQQQYPQTLVQHEATEATFQIVARHLPDAAPSAVQSWTSFLPGLVPNDRLLSRDCQRYVDLCRSKASTSVKRPAKSASPIRLEHHFSLPKTDQTVLSLPVLASAHGWAVLLDSTEYQPQRLILTTWQGIACEIPLARRATSPRLMAIDSHRREIWLKSSSAPQRVSWSTHPHYWDVISPEHLPSHTVAALPEANVTRVLSFDEHFVAWVSFQASNGTYVRSFRVAEEWLGDPKHVVPLLQGKVGLHACGDQDTITFLPLIYGQIFAERFDRAGTRLWAATFPGERAVCVPFRHSTSALILQKDAVLAMEDVCQPGGEQRILSGWDHPHAAFLTWELFVVVDEHRLAIFNNQETTPIFETSHTAATPIAVAFCGIARFSVLRSDGQIEVWTW